MQLSSLSLRTWLAIVFLIGPQCPWKHGKIHTCIHARRESDIGQVSEEETDKSNHTHGHTHFYLLEKGHLQFCRALQGGQRSGFDNWREFREQTFDKHDNALTALIGLWLMTDISVACLVQNANAALGENYPNVAPNLMQEVSRKVRTRWGFFLLLKQGFITENTRVMMRGMLQCNWNWPPANPSNL